MACCKKIGQGCGSLSNDNSMVKNTTDYLVCTCMGVMYQEIREAIKNGANTYESLSEKLGVGTGCNSCVAEVHAILKEEARSGCCKS
jgi:bacterioferritin-associated ferredoxin